MLEPRLATAARDAGGRLVLDASRIETLDLTGAWLLRAFEARLRAAGARVEWQPERPRSLDFIDRTEAGSRPEEPEVAPHEGT